MGLVRNLTEDTKKLIRQELELAKAELAEKFASFGKNAVAVAIGGFVAYAGFIVFLMGLGWLVAWALQKAGLEPVLAGFIGLAGVGIVIIAIGAAFLMTGLKAFSKESLAPEKTIHTIQRLKGSEAQVQAKPEPEPAEKVSSAEIQAKVIATEDRMTGELSELGERLTPRHLNEQVKHQISEKPYYSAAVAMVAGLVSGLFLRRATTRS